MKKIGFINNQNIVFIPLFPPKRKRGMWNLMFNYFCNQDNHYDLFHR